MKTLKCLSVFFLAVFFMIFFLMSQSALGEKTYKMNGKIKAIDRAYNTVVIEVPLEKGMFTVGGPLSPDAVLTKAKKKVTLEEFAVGDRVVILWQHTDSGHIINAIKGR